MLELGQSII